jgi:F-type H+-transporting ATPase subunit b
MIEINLFLLVTQVVTFLVAMVIVWKLFWGPLTQLMRQRATRIAEDVQRAEQGRREIEALEADYHHRLAALEAQVRQSIQDAVAKGNVAKDELLAEARAEAKRILDKAQADLALERERVVRELRAQVTDISLAALERLLGTGLDVQAQKRLLDQFVKDVQELKPVS